jgi:hypothetical protein
MKMEKADDGKKNYSQAPSVFWTEVLMKVLHGLGQGMVYQKSVALLTETINNGKVCALNLNRGYKFYVTGESVLIIDIKFYDSLKGVLKKIKIEDHKIGQWKLEFSEWKDYIQKKVSYVDVLNGQVMYPVFFKDIDQNLDLVTSMSLKKANKYCEDIFEIPIKFFPFVCQMNKGKEGTLTSLLCKATFV